MTQHPPAGPLYEQPRADPPVSRPCRRCEQVDGVHINHFVTCPQAAEVRADQQRKRSAAARR